MAEDYSEAAVRALSGRQVPTTEEARPPEEAVSGADQDVVVESANRRAEEHLSRITDKAVEELTHLGTDISDLIAKIKTSHAASLGSISEHTRLVVDAIATKVIIAEQVASMRQKFDGRRGR